MGYQDMLYCIDMLHIPKGSPILEDHGTILFVSFCDEILRSI